MPSNFEYLITRKEYALFANACTEAERVFASSPVMSAVGCRKALELAATGSARPLFLLRINNTPSLCSNGSTTCIPILKVALPNGSPVRTATPRRS